MQAPPCPILYQDAHALVVDKPAGVLTVPAPDRREPNLLDLLARFSGDAGKPAPLAVHRLDLEATGTILFAADEPAREFFAARFREHAVVRIYHALVLGRPRPVAGVIDSPLATGDDDLVRSGRGRRAVTHYRVLSQQGDCALIECELETGRRNQIRVHLADCGWPLVGDRKYGRVHGYKKQLLQRARRTLLHAVGLGIASPAGGYLTATAPWPADLVGLAGVELAVRAQALVASRLRAERDRRR